ncbi:hypothetical protein GH714_015815 [Hevea brasiliensis]|uniref:Rhodopsin n=1 Tax=Hevea brasiliensis TaxID=3981 RepID=A0A6A6L1I7_HEVBR|nr:hypothetical protein GH714_015815 [Hevea brasiliensis]
MSYYNQQQQPPVGVPPPQGYPKAYPPPGYPVQGYQQGGYPPQGYAPGYSQPPPRKETGFLEGCHLIKEYRVNSDGSHDSSASCSRMWWVGWVKLVTSWISVLYLVILVSGWVRVKVLVASGPTRRLMTTSASRFPWSGETPVDGFSFRIEHSN